MFWVRLLFFSMGFSLAGCSQNLLKNDAAENSASSQMLSPLSKSLDKEAEFDFVLDLVRLAIQQQRWNEAEELAQRYRKQNLEDIRIYRLLAEIYQGSGETEKSIIALEQVLKLEGAGFSDKAALASAYLSNNHFEKAEQILQGLINTSEKTQQVLALNNLGFSKLLQKQFIDAKDYFEKALEIDPLNSKSSHNLKLVNAILNEPK